MRTKLKRHLVILLLLLIGCTLLLQTPMYAALEQPADLASGESGSPQPRPGTGPADERIKDEASGTAIENLFLFPEDLVIQGVTNRQDYYFEVTSSRTIDAGSYVELLFSHSKTLLPKKSTLTVLVDDRPIGSQFLTDANQQSTTWRIDLSELPFEAGFHKFSVITHMEASANLCDDQNNPANWLILQRESVLHLNLKQSFSQADFTYYPSPFLEKGSLAPLKAWFVLPDQPTEEQLTTLGKLSMFMASEAGGRLLPFQVVSESDLGAEAAKHHLIWVGSTDSWQGKGTRLVEAGASDGRIQLLTSPWNADRTVLTVWGSDAELRTAVSLLTESSLYRQLTGTSVGLAELPSVKPDERSSRSLTAISLEELGYSDLVIESMLVGSSRIAYSIPTEIDITKPASLNLRFSHAKTLNFAQSLLTVKVNGVPVASRYLSEETGDFGLLEVNIPPQLMTGRSLLIDASFQFSSSTGTGCTGNTQIGNWAVISNDSTLRFEARPSGSLLIDELPYPFIVREQWRDTVALLPEAPASAELSLYATMCGLFGSNAAATPEDPDQFRAALADGRIEERFADRHLIYIGLADKLPSELHEELDVRYVDGTFAGAGEQIRLLPEAAKSSALLALTASPYGGDKQALVVTADTDQALAHANRQLTDPKVRANLTGTTLLIDARSRVHVLATAEPEAVQQTISDTLSKMFDVNKSPIYGRALFVALFVGVLAVVGLLLWMTRRRNR